MPKIRLIDQLMKKNNLSKSQEAVEGQPVALNGLVVDLLEEHGETWIYDSTLGKRQRQKGA